MTKSAIVTRISVRGDACPNGRIATRSTTTPIRNAITIVTKNAGQNEKPWFVVSDQQMKVVNIAISPWAKLTTRVVR